MPVAEGNIHLQRRHARLVRLRLLNRLDRLHLRLPIARWQQRASRSISARLASCALTLLSGSRRRAVLDLHLGFALAPAALLAG